MRALHNTRAAWLLAALAILLPQACDTGGLVGGGCKDGRLFCNGECIDPRIDPQNCGKCDNICSPGLICSQGDCVPPGETGGSGGVGNTGGQSGNGGTGNGAQAGVGADAGAAGDGGGGGAAGGSNTGGGGRGGNVSQGGRGGQPTAGTAGEGGALCIPPFDVPEHCGDCNTACVEPNPLCAPDTNGGYECVPVCPPPLVNCGDQCVDINVSPLHCGACNNLCPSGICSGGKCVGANPGHVALYCLDYTWAQATTAHTVLLGNAVFLPLRSEVRILAYTRFAPTAVRNQVNRVIAWSATARNKTYRIDAITQASLLSSELNVQDYDVFLIYEQADAPAGQLASIGATWQTTGVLQSFAEAGGVIIALDGAQGTSEMASFIDAAGLLALNGHTPIAVDDTTTRFFNRAPGDALGVGVVSPLSPVPYSCTFDTAVTPSSDTVFVVTDAAAPMLGNPVVVHRTVAP